MTTPLGDHTQKPSLGQTAPLVCISSSSLGHTSQSSDPQISKVAEQFFTTPNGVSSSDFLFPSNTFEANELHSSYSDLLTLPSQEGSLKLSFDDNPIQANEAGVLDPTHSTTSCSSVLIQGTVEGPDDFLKVDLNSNTIGSQVLHPFSQASHSHPYMLHNAYKNNLGTQLPPVNTPGFQSFLNSSFSSEKKPSQSQGSTVSKRKQKKNSTCWSKAEDETLKKLIPQIRSKSGTASWKKIAQCIPGKNRFQCLYRAKQITTYKTRKSAPRVLWTEAEINCLNELLSAKHASLAKTYAIATSFQLPSTTDPFWEEVSFDLFRTYKRLHSAIACYRKAQSQPKLGYYLQRNTTRGLTT